LRQAKTAPCRADLGGGNSIHFVIGRLVFLHEAGRLKNESWWGEKPHRIDGWWDRPPQDSERRALAGTSSKNPSQHEASFYELRFVPARLLASRSRRQGSSMNDPAYKAPDRPCPRARHAAAEVWLEKR